MKELINIQSELKAPKNQKNTFGNYQYRSAEDILEAVKPLLKKNECHLTISDEIVMVGERIYVKATARLSKGEEVVEVTAFAREEESKKGFDSSQLTGSTSSYARKYALNGLFCIDDTKDSDFTNTHGKDKVPAKKTQTPPKKANIDKEMEQAKVAVSKSKSTKDLTEVWDAFKNLQGIPEFKTLMSARRKEVE